MATSRPRHMITETDDIAAAIDAAPSQLPGARGVDALRHLVLAGAEQILDTSEVRRARIHRRAGRFTGMCPDGYLADLRREWPE